MFIVKVLLKFKTCYWNIWQINLSMICNAKAVKVKLGLKKLHQYIPRLIFWFSICQDSKKAITIAKRIIVRLFTAIDFILMMKG